MNQFRLVKENEVNKERVEFESFKRELQIQLRYSALFFKLSVDSRPKPRKEIHLTHSLLEILPKNAF